MKHFVLFFIVVFAVFSMADSAADSAPPSSLRDFGVANGEPRSINSATEGDTPSASEESTSGLPRVRVADARNDDSTLSTRKSASNADSTIHISAKNFSMDEKKGIAIASGEVVVTKGSDELRADAIEVIIKDKAPIFYTATGAVSFRATSKENKKIEGSAKKITHDVAANTYRLYQNATLIEKGERDNIVRGDEIFFGADGSASVTGKENAPAKIIWTLPK